MKKINVIRCPKCGMEYLPEEIYYQDKFFGYPKNIVRDEEGKIIYFDGESLDLTEELVCDKCGCVFEIEGKINFETSINDDKNFDEEYIIKLDKEEIDKETSNIVTELW